MRATGPAARQAVSRAGSTLGGWGRQARSGLERLRPEPTRADPAAGYPDPAAGYPDPPARPDPPVQGPRPEPAAAPAPARPGRVRIDPRFARRWAEVRRSQGRRRLRILLAAATLVTVVGAGAGTLYSPLLRVRHVHVAVVGAVPAAQVLALSGLGHYRLMIDEHPAATAARLDAVPDLGGAQVTKSWPGTVSIRVWVRTGVAQVARPAAAGHPAAWATVDPTGRVLAWSPTPLLSLPLVQGVGALPQPGQWIEGSAGPAATRAVEAGAPAVDLRAASDDPAAPRGPAAALAVAAALPADIRPDVLSITVAAGGAVSLTVLPANVAAGSITVVLGDGSQLAAKLTALTTLLTQTSLSGVSSVNLTVPDRPAALTAR